MKKVVLYVSMFLFAGLYGCGDTTLGEVVGVANEVLNGETESGPAPLTNMEVISGLKEALSVGTNNAAGGLSKEGGFLNNALVRIPFPPEAIKVKEKAEELGLNGPIDKFVTTMNAGASEAAKEAGPIFLQAITEMTIADGFNILKGGDDAATNYLREKTTDKLIAAFSPKVGGALEKVELTKYWDPLASAYNTATLLTGGEKVDPDLQGYVTGKAVDGMFLMISQEETKIRKDPVARVTDILKRVFGSAEAQGN